MIINPDSREVTLICMDCKKSTTLQLTDEQIKRWREGELIQNVMPELTEDERELLISGICGKCFDSLFDNLSL